jgi:putative ABC transport system permease protein
MPFLHSFLDESFDEMYRAEQRIGKVALIFAFLTILIACLGLLGLVTYITEQRIKEIGIRKVLGASVPSIVGLLSMDFLKLVLISICIASPLAYFAMKNWLQDFAFRVHISWWIFVIAGIFTILVSILTVSYQAIKAALMNPLKSLKTE